MDISDVTWRKASYSGGNGGECIEVASADEPLIAVRDSKNPGGPQLVFNAPGWQLFVQRMRRVTLDER